jgi:hypothetical protein
MLAAESSGLESFKLWVNTKLYFIEKDALFY